MSNATCSTEVLICVKCRAQETVSEGDVRPGQLLFEAARSGEFGDGIRVIPVECLSNCSRGCSVALRETGKWTYVYGNLSADKAEILLEGAEKYRRSADGLVPWRERPEHFRKNCIARIPPLET